MSLYKRGNTWWVRFTNPSGERIQRSAGTSEKQKAQEYHDRLKAELWRVHQLGERPRRTWQEAVVRWLKDTEHKADRKKDIAKFRWLDSYLSKYYLDDINRDVIDHIKFTKRDESSPSTANRYLALIRAVLNMAKDEWEWIDKVPKVRMYPEPKKRVRYLTHKEAARLLDELPEHLADMAEFSLATGLRQSNVSYLEWSQVDLTRCMAWIHADQSKSRQAIVVPLNDNAIRVIRRRQGTHPSYVFTYNGQPVARTTTKAWKKALDRAGIKNFRWHDLRHTWASWHVQSGTSLQELMELGGWHSLEMVLRYAHLAGDHLLDAAKRIDGTNLVHRDKSNGLKLVISR